MSRHHPSETLLLEFATGSLPLPHRRVVAFHLASCPECAGQVRVLEAAGGALLDALPPAPLAAGARERVLARLDERPKEAATRAPSTLAEIATGRWRWSGPGVAMMPLIGRDASGARLDLIRVKAGMALLEHGHGGLETTAVLQGAFDDGVERHEAGDFAEADGHYEHQPRALEGADCICLIATSGHLRARSWLGRLVGPLLGM